MVRPIRNLGWLVAATVLGLGLAAIGWGLGSSRSPNSDSATPVAARSTMSSSQATVTVTETATSTVTTTITRTAPAGPGNSSPSAPAQIRPQGELVLDEWHDTAGDLTCAEVQTFYDNRSDTAVATVTQTFLTNYTPKHRERQYPDSVDGPSKTLTQTVGIAPYSRKMIMWRLFAPELASKQNPPSSDGTDSVHVGDRRRS